MNSFGKSLLALAGFCLVAGAAHADNRGKQPVKSIVEFGAIPGKLDAKQFRRLPAPAAAPSADGAQAFGPAPGLTSLQINYLASSNYAAQYPTTGGYEWVGGFQSMTTGDHGGQTLLIITDEYGYGDNPVATWNGGQVSLATNYKTENICLNWAGTGYQICQAGQTIVGFVNGGILAVIKAASSPIKTNRPIRLGIPCLIPCRLSK